MENSKLLKECFLILVAELKVVKMLSCLPVHSGSIGNGPVYELYNESWNLGIQGQVYDQVGKSLGK